LGVYQFLEASEGVVMAEIRSETSWLPKEKSLDARAGAWWGIEVLGWLYGSGS